ncbi:MAG: hypothetical protein NC922_04270 [Candidatus Omnitrophica bacterium]|nr:hypothetical protein [Candidatus Omnitrophota bacterium]
MDNFKFLLEFTKKVCEIGSENPNLPPVYEVDIFKNYFTSDKILKVDELDEFDGKFKRREIFTRYLLLNVVLDQGPDIVGIRELLKNVVNQLYRNEIQILHSPIDFFREMGISIDEIVEKHQEIKNIRSQIWAKEVNSSPSKYNLFFTQSQRGIVSTKQVLDFAVHRWGVPLCCFYLLEKDLEKQSKTSYQPFVDWIESFKSAEFMANQIKNDERYGLGSAIGDKACHLFTKFYVSIFKLSSKKDNAWSDISYEIPFDSNVGRVLWRTGFFLCLVKEEDFKKYKVIQKEIGKKGKNYLRITNIRGKKINEDDMPDELKEKYNKIMKEYFKVKSRKIEIQRIPNLLVYVLNEKGNQYSIANFDDGLVNIGTNYCYNHENPKCENCPLNELCIGYKEKEDLIQNYTT